MNICFVYLLVCDGVSYMYLYCHVLLSGFFKFPLHPQGFLLCWLWQFTPEWLSLSLANASWTGAFPGPTSLAGWPSFWLLQQVFIVFIYLCILCIYFVKIFIVSEMWRLQSLTAEYPVIRRALQHGTFLWSVTKPVHGSPCAEASKHTHFKQLCQILYCASGIYQK